MASPTPDETRLSEIRELLAKTAVGPWSWSHSYEIPDLLGKLHKHWCLHNPESAAVRSCIDGYLVLEATYPADREGKPLDETPNFRLIAAAPADLGWACDTIERLREENRAMRERLATQVVNPESASLVRGVLKVEVLNADKYDSDERSAMLAMIDSLDEITDPPTAEEPRRG